MGRALKTLLLVIGGLIGLLVIGAVSFLLLFDPNDYRDDIAAEVKLATGRELIIEGDVEVSIFPWLAIEIGSTRLGNAAGFGDEPFASFERVRLSIRLMPMLISRKLEVATADVDKLRLNLAIDSNGRSNWQDFIDASEEMASAPVPESEDETESDSGALDISGIEIRDAVIRYSDAQAGGSYTLTELNLATGSLTSDENNIIRIDGFSIDALVEGVADVPTTFRLDTSSIEMDGNAEMISLDRVELSLLGLDISADVEPFSYADEITPIAAIQVDAFSLRNLMQRLDIEAPETADPNALGKVSIDATVRVSSTALTLTDLTLVMDETTFTGELSIPQGDNDIYRLELTADSIDLDKYMAPAVDVESTAAADEPPIEIPSELIRLINARGSLKVGDANLGGMRFENVELGLNTNNGNLRLHPISATLFEGTYNGDVRIDASGDTPVMSVNERIEGVQLGALAQAMFEQDNISGTINGSFKLSGRGSDLAAIQRDLDGEISFELVDGAWEGTDIWYELRRARATIKQEPAPEPQLPARTQFSQVRASGPVRNGVFSNNDLLAELPFMQLTGKGSVNFVEATVDYRISARVFDKPELIGDDISADELKDFTKTVIPIRVSGSLTAPSISPDVGKLLEEQVKKEVEDKIKDKLEDKLKDLFKF
ncbi:MAG: AsmA family protein [Proteobacteria bacterium]|nr:AsmA family protein [Pseudomonadota bacterium]